MLLNMMDLSRKPPQTLEPFKHGRDELWAGAYSSYALSTYPSAYKLYILARRISLGLSNERS